MDTLTGAGQSSGFLGTDFVAELTVTRTVTDVGAVRDLMYFGFGDGTANPNYYNEPTNAFVFRIHSSAGSFPVHATVNSGFAGNHFVHLNAIGSYNPAGTTFRIEKSGDDVTLSIVGVPGASQTYSVTDLGGVLDGSNGYIFFGNSVLGTTFSNLVVSSGSGSSDPTTKDECKKSGWEQYGFRNQGQCVRFVETGKDSR